MGEEEGGEGSDERERRRVGVIGVRGGRDVRSFGEGLHDPQSPGDCGYCS